MTDRDELIEWNRRMFGSRYVSIADCDSITDLFLEQWRPVPVPVYSSMRQAMAEELLAISSHRDEYNGIDLPGDWFGWAYEWEEGPEAQHRAASELTRHDQDAGIYDGNTQ